MKHGKRAWGVVVVGSLFVGAFAACKGSSVSPGSDGGSGSSFPYSGPSCSGAAYGDTCWSCAEANCAPGCLANDCSNYFSCYCACGGGDAQCAQECAAQVSPACTTCLENIGTCETQSCQSACQASGSSSGTSGGGSGGGSGGISGSSSGGGSDSCSSVGSCIHPPAKPGGPTVGASAPEHNYAIRQLFLGDTDRSGNPSATAWESFGYDLDGLVTTAESTDVCTLLPGSSKQVQVDGNGGIDNAWGSQIIPIWETLDSTYSQTINSDIQSGALTEMTTVFGFDDSAGNTTTATGLHGVELIGGQTAGTPAWTVGTHWPILPGDLTCGPSCPSGSDPVQLAQMQFPAAYQANGTFVSGAAIPLQFVTLLFSGSYTVPIHSAVVTFQPSMPGAVTNGTIAGAMLTSEYVSALQQAAGAISTSLCSGSAFESIAMQLEQASDIVLSGETLSNSAGVQCNAISIGLGFDATEIAIPAAADVTAAPPPPVDPCGG
jgi:hypothetical protein